jgi:hypothetical protein
MHRESVQQCEETIGLQVDVARGACRGEELPNPPEAGVPQQVIALVPESPKGRVDEGTRSEGQPHLVLSPAFVVER